MLICVPKTIAPAGRSDGWTVGFQMILMPLCGVSFMTFPYSSDKIKRLSTPSHTLIQGFEFYDITRRNF